MIGIITTIGSMLARWHGDGYWPPWALVTIGILVILINCWANRITATMKGLGELIPIALAAYVIIYSVVIAEVPPLTMGPGINPEQHLLTKNLVLQALLEFSILMTAFMTGWSYLRRAIACGLVPLIAYHSLFLFIDQVMLRKVSGEAEIGLLGNRSIGASFAVVGFFMAVHFTEMENWKWMRWTPLLALPAVLVSHSAISFIALLAGLVATMTAFVSELFLLFAALAALGLYFLDSVKPDAVFSLDTRWTAWSMFVKFWESHFSIWFGSGLGTFKLWGPATQFENHWHEQSLWLWAHNDWLQVLLELGVIGLVLASLTYVYVLVKSYDRPFLFGGLVALGVVMAGNYPLHQATFALLVWWLCFETIYECE